MVNHRETAIELESRIKTYFMDKKEVVAVYLFGSYAAGKQQSFSDVDIGILFDDKRRGEFFKKKNDYLVELSRFLRKDIHLVILNSASEALLKQIFTRGKVVLINDKKKLARQKMVMFVKIAEFSYYNSLMQSGLIRKIMKDGQLG